MRSILPGLVLALLALALLGWVAMFLQILRNERAVAESREREWAETYLGGVAETFEGRVSAAAEGSLAGWREILAAPAQGGPLRLDLTAGSADGVWTGPVDFTAVDSVPPEFEEWRSRHPDVNSEIFGQALEAGTLKWGWVRDGRDVVAALGLRLLDQGSVTPEFWDSMWSRATDYRNPPLRPGFRLLLLNRLAEARPPDDDRALTYDPLRTWEIFRAVEGRVDDLPDEMAGVTIPGGGDPNARIFFLESRLESMLAEAAVGPELRFIDPQDLAEGRPVARIEFSGFERWIGLAGGTGRGAAGYGRTERMILWTGALSGILLVIGAVTAVLLSRRELNLARLRTDLAASVAHELRTPLAGQRLLLETLLEGKAMSRADEREYLEMAFGENLRLSGLAEEFLTFSRLDRGVLRLELRAVDPAKAVRAAVATLREKWMREDCDLVVDLAEDLPAVAGDEQALVTVLRNLLENAWKYSGDDKRISVAGKVAGDEVSLEVRDNGVGIDPRDHQRVFRPFYQADQRMSRGRGGLGLGLAIVRRLVEAMGGRVELESRKGGGSVFRVHLKQHS